MQPRAAVVPTDVDSLGPGNAAVWCRTQQDWPVRPGGGLQGAAAVVVGDDDGELVGSADGAVGGGDAD